MMNEHVSTQWLAYIEGRLSPHEREHVEAHLAVCAACSAEADDVRRLADVLSAVPRALDAGLAARRAPKWAAVRARVSDAHAPSKNATALRSLPRAAWGAALATCVMVSMILLNPPVQGSVFTATGPTVAVIQTPAAPVTSLAGVPTGATAVAALNSTAPHALGEGQTPAPILTYDQP